MSRNKNKNNKNKIIVLRENAFLHEHRPIGLAKISDFRQGADSIPSMVSRKKNGRFMKRSELLLFLQRIRNIEYCCDLVPWRLIKTAVPLLRCKLFLQIGFHGKVCLPAGDNTRAWKIASFLHAVTKGNLSAKSGTSDL